MTDVDLKVGDRVVFDRMPDGYLAAWAGQKGLVVGFYGVLVEVVMDDPSLHDRVNSEGTKIAALTRTNLSLDVYVIDEESLA